MLLLGLGLGVVVVLGILLGHVVDVAVEVRGLLLHDVHAALHILEGLLQLLLLLHLPQLLLLAFLARTEPVKRVIQLPERLLLGHFTPEFIPVVEFDVKIV